LRADEKERNGQHRVERKLSIQYEQDYEYADHGQSGNDALFDAINDQAFDRVDVVHHPRHQIAGCALIEKLCLQTLQSLVKVAAHVIDDALFELAIEEELRAENNSRSKNVVANAAHAGISIPCAPPPMTVSMMYWMMRGNSSERPTASVAKIRLAAILPRCGRRYFNMRGIALASGYFRASI
jgi:hypothetical protein